MAYISLNNLQGNSSNITLYPCTPLFIQLVDPISLLAAALFCSAYHCAIALCSQHSSVHNHCIAASHWQKDHTLASNTYCTVRWDRDIYLLLICITILTAKNAVTTVLSVQECFMFPSSAVAFLSGFRDTKLHTLKTLTAGIAVHHLFPAMGSWAVGMEQATSHPTEVALQTIWEGAPWHSMVVRESRGHAGLPHLWHCELSCCQIAGQCNSSS